jgi:hypothetical protein
MKPALPRGGADNASDQLRNFNYRSPGEIYSRSTLRMKPSGLSYRRFGTAAEAIRFAMEALPSTALDGCILETDGKRLSGPEVRELYLSQHYPLRRNKKRS